MSLKKICMSAILLALALIISVVENALPPILPVLPYAKLGLANFVILLSIVLLGFGHTLTIVVLKCLLVAIFSGRISGVLYSLPAGVISMMVMWLFIKLRFFSLTGVSCVSGVVHNFVQICMACAITGSVAVFVYLPYLALFGAVAGFATGMLCHYFIKFFPEKVLRKLY